MCFVFVWEQTATCVTYITNWFVFITEIKSVYSAVRTGPLNEAVCAPSFKGYTVKRCLVFCTYGSEVIREKSHIKTQRIGTEVSERCRSGHTRICIPEELIRFHKQEINQIQTKRDIHGNRLRYHTHATVWVISPTLTRTFSTATNIHKQKLLFGSYVPPFVVEMTH
jgi:hypothetical protein